MKSYYEHNNHQGKAIFSGIILIVSTIILIGMMNSFPQGSPRTVSAFITGMFGFAGVQALRRGFGS